MRIGFVVSYLELTGGHIAVVEIANRLAARGHEVLLVYPARSILSRRNAALRRLAGLFPDAVLRRCYRMNGDALDWARFEGEVVRVRDLEEKFMPSLDIVVATAWQTAERVARFGPRVGKKVYFIQHYETWSGSAARVDATWRAPFVRIASSNWLRALARERFAIDDIHVVPYGVDLDAFYPDPVRVERDPPRVGLLVHPEPWKGFADALAALRLVRERGCEVQPVLFGAFEPPEVPPGSELRLRPSRSELRSIYASLDVFLCASWAETGPLTVPEAMACEVCVVSTDVGNVALWANDAEGAYLARPREPDALAAALAAALGDPAERRRRARRGRELIQAYTWDRAAARFAAILREAV